jgi:hypothetical protein
VVLHLENMFLGERNGWRLRKLRENGEN